MIRQLIIPILMFLNSAHATDAPQDTKKCSSTPCANTATGEDPGEIELRAANLELNKIRASSDDKLRWQTITLFSNSKDPKNQKLIVHKESNTEVALEADRGLLVFRSPQGRNAFQIATSSGDADNPCPKYQLEVVDASSEHAIIRKICPKYVYAQGHEFKSFDYYLYDRQTATMRVIWSASALQNVSMLKMPIPDPVVTPTARGYRYQWKGQVALSGSLGNVSYNNLYERKKSSSGSLELICKDMSAGKQGEIEVGSCEGGILPLVSK